MLKESKDINFQKIDYVNSILYFVDFEENSNLKY